MNLVKRTDNCGIFVELEPPGQPPRICILHNNDDKTFVTLDEIQAAMTTVDPKKVASQRQALLVMCRRLLDAMDSVEGPDWTASSDWHPACNDGEALVKEMSENVES